MIVPRVIQRRRRGRATETPGATRPDTGQEQRLRALEERVEHAELALQDLQDATHRQSVHQSERLDELSKKTEPHQLARALSQDARKRGL